MTATSIASSGIVHELLTRDNYERWRVVIQNYLQGQGLWDVVQTANSEVELEALEKMEIDDAKAKKFWNILSAQNCTELKAAPDIEQGLSGHVQRLFEVEREASWKMMKNAKALHIIQLSCGREILDEISRFKTAKEVWNFLSEKYNKDLEVSLDSTDPQAISNYWQRQLKELRLFEKKEANLDIYETTASRWTILHAVTLSGDVRAVKWLVKKGEDRLVGMKDEKGYTALALAARYTGNTDIAKCMIESKKGNSREWLLEMENNDGEIPVLLASVNGYKEMTTYLYFKTPQKVFEGRDSRNRLFLLARCIAAEIFGVALSLLTRYPDLSREALLNLSDFSTENLLRKRVEGNFSILDALAHMPSAFPSGSRFGLRQQFFYHILSVKWEFSNSYGKEIYPDYIGYVRAVTRSGGMIKMLIRWLPGFCRPVLKILRTVMRLGWFCTQRALKLLGPLLGRIAYLLIQIFKWLNIFGIREIYDLKYAHYEVLGIVNCFRKNIADFNDSQLRKASAYDAILHAAQHGISEFVYGISKGNGYHLLSAIDSCRRDIFAGAILNRKQNIFQLMHYLVGVRKETFRYRTDAFGNNLLHLVAHLGPSSDLDSKSGAALQMQREVQWFKAVEEFVHPLCKEAKNGDGKKPHELFTENHKELMKAGEKWAKDIATSFTIVGTLITTIMFTAAFNAPGGNNQETGLPIFLHDKIFITFLVADAVSLFTSATSVIIFIGILTSRYAEKEFLKSLPRKLLFGLLPLILSVCSMIVAFCSALAIILQGYRTYKWFIVGPALSLASIPIIVLVASQLRLMYDIFHSTWKNPIQTRSGGKARWKRSIKKKFKLKPVSTPKST